MVALLCANYYVYSNAYGAWCQVDSGVWYINIQILGLNLRSFKFLQAFWRNVVMRQFGSCSITFSFTAPCGVKENVMLHNPNRRISSAISPLWSTANDLGRQATSKKLQKLCSWSWFRATFIQNFTFWEGPDLRGHHGRLCEYPPRSGKPQNAKIRIKIARNHDWWYLVV